MNLNEINSENQRIREILTFILSAVLTVMIGFILSKVPDHLDTEHILQTYVYPPNNFVAEKSEILQYIICTISFPVLYLAFHFLLRKIHFDCRTTKISRFLYTVCFFGIAAAVIYINFMDRMYLHVFDLSSRKSLDIAFALLAGSFALLCVIVYESFHKKRIWNSFLLICCMAAAFYTSWLFITKTYYFNNSFISYHFDAYFYPVYKVYSGQTPPIDFKNLYGFYPYFIVPLLSLLGGATMGHFSLIVCAMVLVCCLSFLFTLEIVCKNKVVAALGFFAVIAWLVVFLANDPGEWYLQYFPHRVIFPAIFLLLYALQVTAKSPELEKRIRRITFVVVAMALLWNIDTGAVIAIAYSSFLIYRELTVHNLREKALYGKSACILLKTILSAAGAYIFLLVVTSIRTGKIFNASDLFYAQTIFLQGRFLNDQDAARA